MRGTVFGFVTMSAAALAAAAPAAAQDAAQETSESRQDGGGQGGLNTRAVRDFLSNFGLGASASQNLGSSVVDEIGLATLGNGDVILETRQFHNTAYDYVLEAHSLSDSYCGALKTRWIRGCGVYAQLGVSMEDNDLESIGLGFMIGFADLVEKNGTDLNIGFGVNARSGAKKVNRTYVSENLGGGVFVIDPRFADEIRSGALSPLKDQTSVRFMITLSLSPRRSKAR